MAVKLPVTGERMMPEMISSVIFVEHLHRYAFASRFCEDKKILDIASGEGYGSHILSQSATSVIGVDIDKEAVKHAAERYKRGNLSFKAGSADKIPVEDNSIDVAVSFETIEHHDKHEEMMLEIKRVLKPEGLLIISSPDKKFYSDIPKYKNPFHVKELYQHEFDDLLKRHFDNVKMWGQQSGMLSSLTPVEKGNVGEYWQSKGDTGKVEVMNSMSPVFLLALASQGQIQDTSVSLFDGNSIVEDLNKKIADVFRNSRDYRLGNSLLKPLRWVKSVFSK